MNVYIFLVSFSFVYFCFISSICCRRYERHFLGKKTGHQFRKTGFVDGQSGKRVQKPSKVGTRWAIVGKEVNHLASKRKDRSVRASKEAKKLDLVAYKKQENSKHLREEKDSQPHDHILAPEAHKKRRSSYKTKQKSKKYSLAFAPSSSLTTRAQTEDGFQGYESATSGQVRYLTNNLGSPGSDIQGGQENVQFNTQQEGYQTTNDGQNELNGFQENNDNDQERGVEKQSVGMLQALMEQKALLGQQANQQEEMQRLPEQQETAAFQGSQEQNGEGQLLRQENEQQNSPQDGAEQFQQGVGRETTEQQMNVQEQRGQEEANFQEGGEQGAVVQQGDNQEASFQQGAGQEAAFQQGNEQGNGEQQPGQMEASFQQANGPEVVQQQGSEQENYVQQGNEQEMASQHGDLQETAAAYQQDSEQTGTAEQQSESSEQRGTDGGSIANIFADASNQENGQDQDTQSLINEGQSITSTDAAQLAAAIANANKGLTSGGEQNSLANLASNSAGALSFTGTNEQASSNQEGFSDLGSSVNRFTPENSNSNQENNDFSLLEHQEEGNQKGDSFSQQYEENGPIPSHNLEQDFMKFDGPSEHQQEHMNTGIGNIAEDSVKIVNLDHAVANKAAKFCTGCPRNARCIDKVCIINDDEPLAKILGALSGPDNTSSDCNGCHHNAKCIKKECICKPGFTGDGFECRADSCLPGCSKHGKCIRGFCVCDHHHYFNGIECAPYKIRHRACLDKCASSCSPDCPERCCKSHLTSPPKPTEMAAATTAATTTKTKAKTTATTTKPTVRPTGTKIKKIGLDAAADFYLKPTLHNNADLFNKHPHQDKPPYSSDQASSSQLSSGSKGNTLTDNRNNSTKSSKLQSGDKDNKLVAKKKEDCHPECSDGKCKPSCPDHCCLIKHPSTSQIDFLKAFAERFCPSACQNKCQNTCPPICCEKRSFSSILRSSGASDVDVGKAEDIFRNAMGWFGMMNFLHMMYNMYGNMYKPQNMMAMNNPQNPIINAFLKMQSGYNPRLKAEVPKNPYDSAGPCQPMCTETCLSTCPPRCCTTKTSSNKKTPQNGGPNVSNASQTPSKIGESPHVTSCPSTCATLCSPTCPPSCCTHPKVPQISNSPAPAITSKYASPSCKPGCSPKCYPLCMESCCKATQRTVQIRPTARSLVPATRLAKSTYGCPLQCPKSCFPSCSRDCCYAAEQNKPSLLNRHGQYMVSISCPMECRPYNCLAYCHHECCLRTNNSYQRPKPYITNSKAAVNKEASSSRRFGTRSNYNVSRLSQIQNKKKEPPTNKKETKKFSANP